MDHNYAIQNHTAERYLLEELPQDEREAYEEHFFNCSLCAEEVQDASEFIEGARELIQNQVKEELYGHARQHSIWGSWLNWRSIMQPLPAMACLLLVFVSGFSAYQNRVTIPDIKMASVQLLTSEPIALHSARSAVPAVTVDKGKPFVLKFDILSSNYPSYEVSVLTPSNKKLSFKDISAQDARKPIEIAVPANILESGRYVLLIEGVSGNSKGEVDRFTFDLK